MSNLSVVNIEPKYKEIYKSLFDSISLYNKNLEITNNKEVHIVNNSTVDIGVILLETTDDILNVEVFQTPRVCRLSIISLIECAVLLAKNKINTGITSVNFKLNNAISFRFKFKLIFKDFDELDTSIQISSDMFNNIKEEDITFRNITFTVF